MRKLMMIAVMSAWAAVPDSRADLLITKDGKSAWLASYARKDDILAYRTAKDGPEKTIPLSVVDVILPSVQEGAKHTQEQADKALDGIRRASGRHPALRKQIEMLKQQWQQVKEPDTGADGKIDQLVREFNAGDKDPKKFQDIAARMEMIGFRDAAGTLTAKIKKKLTEMQLEVFETARAKIEAMAASDKRTIKNYNNLRKRILEVRMVRATDEQKKYLDEVNEKCRRETMQFTLQASQAAFFANRTVDGYLDSMAILGDLKRSEVPVSDSEKAEADRYIKVILSAAKAECKAYNFDTNGCPLDAQDRKLLSGRKWDSAGEPGGIPTVPHCYLIATDVPVGAKPGDAISFPVRLIFNRAPIPDGKYSLVADFYVPGNTKREVMEVAMQGIKNGHVDTRMQVTIPRLEPNFSGTPVPVPWDGVTGMSLVLAFQGYRAPVSEQMEWIAATAGCWIGFGAPIPQPWGGKKGQ